MSDTEIADLIITALFGGLFILHACLIDAFDKRIRNLEDHLGINYEDGEEE